MSRTSTCVCFRYERTNPVYNNTLNNCGAVHITVGDGGNNVRAQGLLPSCI